MLYFFHESEPKHSLLNDFFQKASEWKTVFWITFIIYVVAVALYTVMASGEKQWWAEGYPKDESEQNSIVEDSQEDDENDDNVVNNKNDDKTDNGIRNRTPSPVGTT